MSDIKVGTVTTLYVSDVKDAVAGLKSLASRSTETAVKLRATTQIARLLGAQLDQMGAVSQRAAALQEKAAERYRLAWGKAEAQQTVALKAAAQAQAAKTRADELAALKADILGRAEAAAQQTRIAAYQAASVAFMKAQYDEAAAREAVASRAEAAAERLAGAATVLGGAEREEAAAAETSAAAHEAVSGAMETEIPRYAATSALVRSVEGGLTNNVRAAERFIGSLSALSNIAMKAFPTIGAATLLYLIVRMGKRFTTSWRTSLT